MPGEAAVRPDVAGDRLARNEHRQEAGGDERQRDARHDLDEALAAAVKAVRDSAVERRRPRRPIRGEHPQDERPVDHDAFVDGGSVSIGT